MCAPVLIHCTCTKRCLNNTTSQTKEIPGTTLNTRFVCVSVDERSFFCVGSNFNFGPTNQTFVVAQRRMRSVFSSLLHLNWHKITVVAAYLLINDTIPFIFYRLTCSGEHILDSLLRWRDNVRPKMMHILPSSSKTWNPKRKILNLNASPEILDKLPKCSF